MNPNDNDDFYYVVKMIVNDKNTRKIIDTISYQQLYDIDCYLDYQMYYPLIVLINHALATISNNILDSEDISDKIINYHKICLDKNLEMTNILITAKHILMKAGAKRKITQESKNIIMEGITVTLRSILDRPVDIDHIDNNLRKGAQEREDYMEKYYHIPKKPITKVNETEPLFDKNTPIKLSNKKYIVTEVSTHPKTEGKHTIHVQNKIKKLSNEDTIKDYQKGVETLNQLEPRDPLDMPLSQPLDQPPVGKSGSTLITSEENSLLKKIQ